MNRMQRHSGSIPFRARKACWLTCAAVVLLAGCATHPAYREGERLIAEGKTEEALAQLEKAVAAEPRNAEYRATLHRVRNAHVDSLNRQADAALGREAFDEAEALYRRALAIHPENPRTQAGLAAVDAARRNRTLMKEAEAAFGKGDYATARTRLRTILAQEPRQPAARELLRQVEEKTGGDRGAVLPQLAPETQRPVTLEFRNAMLKSIFDAISRQSGVSFVFDKDVRPDLRATIFVRDTPIADAVDMLLATSQLAKKVLNPNTLLIYPNQPIKRKEYDDLVVKSFFLTNTDAKTAMNLVKSMAKIKDVFIDEKLNLVVVRDTPEAVRLAERLINVQDRAEPEVMLEVEIMEVKRSKFLELGVQWPTQFSVLTPEAVTKSETTGGVIVTTTTPAGRLTVRDLRNIGWGDLGVSPNPYINLRKDDSDVNLLANPRIRVKSREKAKIHIGDKVPVITTNTTSTGVISESVAYLEVGLKLDVEPLVRLDGDVDMKVGLEVSNIVKEIKSSTGTLTYQLGSRNAATVLRLQDGETQILAGLISDEDRSGATRVPLLGDLPLLGRLFSNQRDENSKTEIVLLITPRVVRTVERPELAQGEFYAGTEGAASDRPMQLRPAGRLAPASPQPEPAPVPESEPEPTPQPAPGTGVAPAPESQEPRAAQPPQAPASP